MGNRYGRDKTAKNQRLQVDELVCPICFASYNLLCLHCGHFFCLNCLEVLIQRYVVDKFEFVKQVKISIKFDCFRHGGVICPFDRKAEPRPLSVLPALEECDLNKIDLVLYEELLRFPHFKKLVAA